MVDYSTCWYVPLHNVFTIILRAASLTHKSGIPHRAMIELNFNGYQIPAGELASLYTLSLTY